MKPKKARKTFNYFIMQFYCYECRKCLLVNDLRRQGPRKSLILSDLGKPCSTAAPTYLFMRITAKIMPSIS